MATGHSAASLAAFNKDQGQYKSLPAGAPSTPQAARANPAFQQYGHNWGTADRYYEDRSRYLSRLPPERAVYWNNPPAWVTNARPSYGSWAGPFMGSLVGGAVGTVAGNAISHYMIDDGSARWAAAHRQTPEFQQWHADMMAQSEHDPDLRMRMVALDSSVEQVVQSGVALDENALPNGIDPSMAVAPDTVLMATSSGEETVTDRPDDNSVSTEH
jgi:hypothetical protein